MKQDKSKKASKLEHRPDAPPLRDLELSVSPIGQSATFSVMDVTSVDEEVSFYGPDQVVKDQPKVSTQKLPHLKARDGFGKTEVTVSITLSDVYKRR